MFLDSWFIYFSDPPIDLVVASLSTLYKDCSERPNSCQAIFSSMAKNHMLEAEDVELWTNSDAKIDQVPTSTLTNATALKFGISSKMKA